VLEYHLMQKAPEFYVLFFVKVGGTFITEGTFIRMNTVQQISLIYIYIHQYALYTETLKKRIVVFMVARHFISKRYPRINGTYSIMQHFFNKNRDKKFEHRFR